MCVVVLLYSGWLLIAEVKSRFDPNTGGADPVKFSKAVNDLGFNSISKVCIIIIILLESEYLFIYLFIHKSHFK